MDSYQLQIILLASVTAIACALPGTFLVLRKVALMSDAISHAILLGLVLAFLVTKNLSSPWLILAAAATGLLTVSLTEAVIHTRKLKKDAAIGLVFPLLFSLGVILLNKFAGSVHLDSDCILFGEIALAPFNRWIVNGVDLGPQGLWVISAIMVLNIVFITAFYKELKLATFDEGLAAALGFRPVWLSYGLMTLVSFTTVGSFEVVGSILVVALMIAPPASAYLWTKRLHMMLILSVVYGILSAVLGYGLAFVLDASIAGSMATMSGILFGLTFIFAPEKGLLAKIFVKNWTRWDFASEMLSVHLLQAEYQHAEETERVVSHMNEHMLWKDQYTSEVIAQCLDQGLIKKQGNRLTLTDLGREMAKNSMTKK